MTVTTTQGTSATVVTAVQPASAPAPVTTVQGISATAVRTVVPVSAPAPTPVTQTAVRPAQVSVATVVPAAASTPKIAVVGPSQTPAPKALKGVGRATAAKRTKAANASATGRIHKLVDRALPKVKVHAPRVRESQIVHVARELAASGKPRA
jgi:hypothetical protein